MDIAMPDRAVAPFVLVDKGLDIQRVPIERVRPAAPSAGMVLRANAPPVKVAPLLTKSRRSIAITFPSRCPRIRRPFVNWVVSV